jgi:hypothetical protein
LRNTIIAIIFSITSAAFAGHLRLENSGYETVAYVREDGRIEDASFMPLGRMVLDEDMRMVRIEDDSFNVLGYIDGNEFLNADEEPMYELTDDGRLKNHRFRDVLSVRDDGTVETPSFSIVLYTDGSHENLKQRIAVYIIYFSDIIEE